MHARYLPHTGENPFILFVENHLNLKDLNMLKVFVLTICITMITTIYVPLMPRLMQTSAFETFLFSAARANQSRLIYNVHMTYAKNMKNTGS